MLIPNNNMLYISNNITLQYNLIPTISTLSYILSLLLLPLMIINTLNLYSYSQATTKPQHKYKCHNKHYTP